MSVYRVDGILSRRAFCIQQPHGFFHFYCDVCLRVILLVHRHRAILAERLGAADMHHTVVLVEIEIHAAAFIHKISAAVSNILMVDPDNMRIKQRNESFPLQTVRFIQFPCRRLRRIGKSLRFRLQELLHAVDQFFYFVLIGLTQPVTKSCKSPKYRTVEVLQ